MTKDEMRNKVKQIFGVGSSWDIQMRLVDDMYVPVLFDAMIRSKKKELKDTIEKLQKELNEIESFEM